MDDEEYQDDREMQPDVEREWREMELLDHWLDYARAGDEPKSKAGYYRGSGSI